MNHNKILVTGSAGFIGYHLCESLLNDGIEVFGVDNLNSYYDINLKHSRLKLLNDHKNFTFEKIDISKRHLITEYFNKYDPDAVVNLAAQAGVRYSIENPYAYLDSNLVGFLNIIELCREKNIKTFIYASSSSVYGKNKKTPFNENDRIDKPISLYSASKAANELIAHSYSNLYDIKTTGLRFFTVYGPWGRPDMAMFIFTKNILDGKPINVFNNGKMQRDFTFINDIVSGIRLSLEKNYKCEIFNLGNNKMVNLLKMISIIENKLNIKAKIKFKPLQDGDVIKTFSDINKSLRMLNYRPTVNIEQGIPMFIDWYKKFYNI